MVRAVEPLARSWAAPVYNKHPSLCINSEWCLCTSRAFTARQRSGDRILFLTWRGVRKEQASKQAKPLPALSIRQRSGSEGHFGTNSLLSSEATSFPALATPVLTFFREPRLRLLHVTIVVCLPMSDCLHVLIKISSSYSTRDQNKQPSVGTPLRKGPRRQMGAAGQAHWWHMHECCCSLLIRWSIK